ncbi:hypothetical protein JW905_10515 [bacterium]|nr:hypothetical protein [candidate division CSSED10-310 bacterium]
MISSSTTNRKTFMPVLLASLIWVVFACCISWLPVHPVAVAGDLPTGQTGAVESSQWSVSTEDSRIAAIKAETRFRIDRLSLSPSMVKNPVAVVESNQTIKRIKQETEIEILEEYLERAMASGDTEWAEELLSRIEIVTGTQSAAPARAAVSVFNASEAQKDAAVSRSMFTWLDYAALNWMTPVKEQGYDDSWAFAVLGATEAIYKITAGNGTVTPDLSEQYMVSCLMGHGNYVPLSDALSLLKNYGITDECCFPYDGSLPVPACSGNACGDANNRLHSIDLYGAVSPTVADIKTALQTYGPLPTTVTVNSDFLNYSGGVFSSCARGDARAVQHVVIVGWNDDDPEGACWICKNSWGDDWGEDTYGDAGERGYFRIALGSDCSGIESSVYFIDGKTLPDLTDSTPSGWDYPIVMRNDTSCSDLSCPVPATLSGNTISSYFSVATHNSGTIIAQQAYQRLYIDDEYIRWFSWSYVGSGSTNNYVNLGPHMVKGGRHTMRVFYDDPARCVPPPADGTVWEVDESDGSNNYRRQYIWSPLPLTVDSPEYRTSPPNEWTGGTYRNCDGFSFTTPAITGFAAGVGMLSPNYLADYDLYGFDDYSGAEAGFANEEIASLSGPNQSELIIYCGYPNHGVTRWAGVTNSTGNASNFYVQADAYDAILETEDTPLVGGIDVNKIFDIYEVNLDSGIRYVFNLYVTDGDADIGITLYGPEVADTYYAKDDYITGCYADDFGDGDGESFVWDCTQAGTYIFAVWKVNSEDYQDYCSYTLAFAPPTPTPTLTPTKTPTLTPTFSPTFSPTLTPTLSPTLTPTPTEEPPTPTPSTTPTVTKTATMTVTPTITLTPTFPPIPTTATSGSIVLLGLLTLLVRFSIIRRRS